MNFRSLLENSRSLTNAQFGSTAAAGAASTTSGGTKAPTTVDWMDMAGGASASASDQMDGGLTAITTAVTIPRIERPLDQLELQSRKLWQKTTRSRDGASEARAYVPWEDWSLGLTLICRSLSMCVCVCGVVWCGVGGGGGGGGGGGAPPPPPPPPPRQYLLAGRGFDAERVSQTLNSIKMAQAFEPLQPLEDTDVEGYLRNEHELMIVSCIEEARREVGPLPPPCIDS